MRANPGGQIAPQEVLGRDILIDRIWHLLDRQSVILTAERRIGKTQVIKKMEAEPRPGWVPVYRDLEQVHTVGEFARLVCEDVETHLSRAQRTSRHVQTFLRNLGGAEAAGVRIPEIAAVHWKQLLRHTLHDLHDNQDRAGHRVVLLWDEVPLMLYNLRQREGAAVAMELLDQLRSGRQELPALRMVFTGSIGMHIVIRDLKRSGYANQPVNDMDTEDVPPLAEADAIRLAQRLLQGERIATPSLAEAARAIAECTDGKPFLIHRIVDALAGGPPATAEVIGMHCDAALTDPDDRWELRHYRDRLNLYYDDAERSLALDLLDAIAVADGPLAFGQAWQRMKSRRRRREIEVESARDVLELLLQDHYLQRNANGRCGFRFPLVKRRWRIHRGLA